MSTTMSTGFNLDTDNNFSDFLSPNPIPPNAPTTGEDSSIIAPFLDEVLHSSSLKQNQRTLGFNSRRSISSFHLHRQSNASTPTLVRGRGSESASIADTMSSTLTERTSNSDTRKSKSSISFINNFNNIIKKKASRSSRDELIPAIDFIPPPLPAISYSSPSSSFSPVPPSPPPFPKKFRGKQRPRSPGPGPPMVPPKDAEIKLDLNIDKMDGIVDPSALSHEPIRAGGDASSPSSGFESSYLSSSIGTTDGILQVVHSSSPEIYPSLASATIFRDPFSSTIKSGKKRPTVSTDQHKVSPKTIVSVSSIPRIHMDDLHAKGWSAPESWAVEKEQEEIIDVPDYTSSDDDQGSSHILKQQAAPKRSTRRGGRTQSLTIYRLRIHRSDGSYHVVKCPLTTTVSELSPVLLKKVVLNTNRSETHTLYIKERDRERALLPHERPADLVRRRLEQAGYDVADGLHTLGTEEIGFIIKFIYKSNLLGSAEKDLNIDNREHIDFTGKSLKTIPIALHSRADTIITLNLSRNPMLEIPLDFIQACGTLRELRLSNMAMKKVPQSVRNSESLQRLDISSNRIGDLAEAGLDQIKGLIHLKAQNNRMDKLPWWFPRIRTLRYVNISNNKFEEFPDVLFTMTNLVDLDISFNNLKSIPEGIQHLCNLQRLVIVGNQISKIPDECTGLVRLEMLDCRRNNISDLSLACKLPNLQTVYADHNAIHALDLAVGSNLQTLDMSYNDITQLQIAYGPAVRSPYRLTSLNISHAKLSTLDSLALSHLHELKELRLDHNSFRSLPDALGSLRALEHLSCSNNKLDTLPDGIGSLLNLRILDVHSNSLTELPVSMWQCGSLRILNVTSNLLKSWHDPPISPLSPETTSPLDEPQWRNDRRPSSTESLYSPLAYSLQRLYLGENRLTDEVLLALSVLKKLRVLNLSFNDIQELPPSFFANLLDLEELYLSGNKLSALPTEHLPRLTKLTVLFLNGNKLQVLPHELGKVTSLTVLDVGSNVLKYNINNWEYDWNWNFNQNLRYLNLSGNKRLKIQEDGNQRMSSMPQVSQRKILSGFTDLMDLRVLGLMDVTTTVSSGVPEESEDRRVRTSDSEVNGMPYGIADSLNKKDHLNMVDLVQPNFRGRKDECIFAMFGRSHGFSSSNRIPKFLSEHFAKTFSLMLDKLDKYNNEGIPDALRRTFLLLNKNLHAYLSSAASRKLSQNGVAVNSANTSTQYDASILRTGASGIVAYFTGKTIFVANSGDALAVVSRQGTAKLVSRKHEPFDRAETARIRSAEGWVSPRGLVNEESPVSRSFGYYHLLPAVNPRPDIYPLDLSELDEFVIIANRGLWDYVSYQTAVDIARSEKEDPTIAAQKLRDFAMSYGAEGSTMIMVIRVSGWLDEINSRSRQPTTNPLPEEDASFARRLKPRNNTLVGDVTLARLPTEISAPTGHVALVFTDIRNSTHLWESNPGMPTAMRIHNDLLRRHLRLLGGYEVKTEGDAFMCAFHNSLSAVLWCFRVQVELLNESWPLEILECKDGKEILDSSGNVIFRGLSVRMGIHSGNPVCEIDPVTRRMDYFGPMVNRASRICGSAAGGQIMCSADVIREVKGRLFEMDTENEISSNTSKAITDTLREYDPRVVDAGETKMKGLEVPEYLSAMYPAKFLSRIDFTESTMESDASNSKMDFSISQMRHLSVLCVRIEVLTSFRVYRPILRDTVTSTDSDQVTGKDKIISADPAIFYPNILEKVSDHELMALLDSLTIRIENAVAALTFNKLGNMQHILDQSLLNGDGVDLNTLSQLTFTLKTLLSRYSSSS